MKSILRIATLACLTLLSVAAFGQTVKEVFAFNSSLPSSGGGMTPAQGRNGKLYGSTTGAGLTTSGGSIVNISVGGKADVIYTFSQANTASSNLTLATDGDYYGVVGSGGSSNVGLLFKINSIGAYTSLYNFTGSSDGRYPAAPPIQASDGNLYGTTGNGSADDGTIYKFVPATGVFTTIYSFPQDGTHGTGIIAPLIQATDGNLYGTASAGGASGCGTIFSLSMAGKFLTAYSFSCGSGGNMPLAPLVQASDGNFYGTTLWGGMSLQLANVQRATASFLK